MRFYLLTILVLIFASSLVFGQMEGDDVMNWYYAHCTGKTETYYIINFYTEDEFYYFQGPGGLTTVSQVVANVKQFSLMSGVSDAPGYIKVPATFGSIYVRNNFWLYPGTGLMHTSASPRERRSDSPRCRTLWTN